MVEAFTCVYTWKDSGAINTNRKCRNKEDSWSSIRNELNSVGCVSGESHKYLEVQDESFGEYSGLDRKI